MIYEEVYKFNLKKWEKRCEKYDSEKNGNKAKLNKLVIKLLSLDQELLHYFMKYWDSISICTKQALIDLKEKSVGSKPNFNRHNRLNNVDYQRIVDDVQLAMLDAKDIDELMNTILKKHCEKWWRSKG